MPIASEHALHVLVKTWGRSTVAVDGPIVVYSSVPLWIKSANPFRTEPTHRQRMSLLRVLIGTHTHTQVFLASRMLSIWFELLTKQILYSASRLL